MNPDKKRRGFTIYEKENANLVNISKGQNS